MLQSFVMESSRSPQKCLQVLPQKFTSIACRKLVCCFTLSLILVAINAQLSAGMKKAKSISKNYFFLELILL